MVIYVQESFITALNSLQFERRKSLKSRAETLNSPALAPAQHLWCAAPGHLSQCWATFGGRCTLCGITPAECWMPVTLGDFWMFGSLMHQSPETFLAQRSMVHKHILDYWKGVCRWLIVCLHACTCKTHLSACTWTKIKAGNTMSSTLHCVNQRCSLQAALVR